MPHYLLSVHGPMDDNPIGGYASEEEMQQAFEDTGKVNDEMQQKGIWVFAGGLMPISSSTTVSSKNGDVTMTDGPYAETKEYLGGFWIIDVPDLDAALEWAAKASEACVGAVEVRPFQGLA
ncbi:MAG TPA: YciI family protein [Acidimicrobiales bacterium]|nr:YciI family protein [Acidimicrobiales bacterium]